MGRRAVLAKHTEAKKKHGHGAHTAKMHWKKEQECQKTDCSAFHPDEAEDCLAKCVSETCYNEVYASEPLEPGEVDKKKSSDFNGCVKKESDAEKKRKAEEAAAAKEAASKEAR